MTNNQILNLNLIIFCYHKVYSNLNTKKKYVKTVSFSFWPLDIVNSVQKLKKETKHKISIVSEIKNRSTHSNKILCFRYNPNNRMFIYFRMNQRLHNMF